MCDQISCFYVGIFDRNLTKRNPSFRKIIKKKKNITPAKKFNEINQSEQDTCKFLGIV